MTHLRLRLLVVIGALACAPHANASSGVAGDSLVIKSLASPALQSFT